MKLSLSVERCQPIANLTFISKADNQTDCAGRELEGNISDSRNQSWTNCDWCDFHALISTTIIGDLQGVIARPQSGTAEFEDAGIIGPFEGSKARKVLVPDEMSLEQMLQKGDA